MTSGTDAPAEVPSVSDLHSSSSTSSMTSSHDQSSDRKMPEWKLHKRLSHASHATFSRLSDQFRDKRMSTESDDQSDSSSPRLVGSVSMNNSNNHGNAHYGMPDSSHSPVLRLPPELLAIIHSFLPTKADEWAFVLTCKPWFLACADAIWYRPHIPDKATLQLLVRTLGQPSAATFLPYGRLVRRLNLSLVADHVDDSVLINIAHACTELERLTLTGCSKVTDAGLMTIVSINPRLQSIDMSQLELVTDEAFMCIAYSCPRLGGCYASNCKLLTDRAVMEMASRCRNLKRVKFAGCPAITDASVSLLIDQCPSLVEIDVTGCSEVSNDTVTRALQSLTQLRELRLASLLKISDDAFVRLPTDYCLDRLRIVDLTGCVLVTDDSVHKLVQCAPRLRNVVLAKCVNITDNGVQALTRLKRSLHYLHLGHCSNITDKGIAWLVEACQRIMYIDVACCTQLTNEAVKDLAMLPRLRRIGLVKCQNITDEAIFALADRSFAVNHTTTTTTASTSNNSTLAGTASHPLHPPPPPSTTTPATTTATTTTTTTSMTNTLERIHLSYCTNITLASVIQLVNSCPRLTHLSLTGVPAFMRHDLTQFCRSAPPEFTQHQQAVFCVFSGKGIERLRNHLNSIMLETEYAALHLPHGDPAARIFPGITDAALHNYALRAQHLPPGRLQLASDLPHRQRNNAPLRYPNPQGNDDLAMHIGMMQVGDMDHQANVHRLFGYHPLAFQQPRVFDDEEEDESGFNSE
uniref:ARAD1B18898p n=1 Tax=Blastobotrys adeninivorans TaxID=409370 RepID=A0A060TC04_BLAAD